jgi:hypothetical protein
MIEIGIFEEVMVDIINSGVMDAKAFCNFLR